MTNLEQKLDAVIQKWSLLDHPFYRAWTMGTLPTDHLKLYSSEYASFIGMVAKGWEACGNAEIAEEEVEHYDLWKDFAKSLGHNEVNTTVSEVSDLVAACEKNYENKVTALGALYAFEKQQPATAKSKLEGLRTHYSGLNADETYFIVHENDIEEPALLMDYMNELNTADQDKALAACEEICEKVYNALTGIMETAEA